MATFTCKAELQQQVEAATKQWKSTGDKPPYSPTQLVTMALVMHDKPMQIPDIAQWVGDTFTYYKLVLPMYDSPKHQSSLAFARLAQRQTLLNSLSNGLDALETPAFRSNPHGDPWWTVEWAHARIYLQRALGFEPQGTFPFLHLPAEMRDNIYDMVFRYPPSGVSIGLGSDGNKEFRTVDKDFQASFDVDNWITRIGRAPVLTYKEPVQQTLSLLLVNKQVFQEAFVHFYQNNLFFFSDVEDLNNFLRNLPPYRRQHLTQLAFDYTPGRSGLKIAPKAFKFLASLPNLRKLYVKFNGPQYNMRFQPSFEDQKANILSTPGVTALRAIRGLEEVVFSGDSALIEQMLKPSMESPASNTRKRDAVEMEEWGRPQRAAKAKKVKKR